MLIGQIVAGKFVELNELLCVVKRWQIFLRNVLHPDSLCSVMWESTTLDHLWRSKEEVK